MPNYPQPSKLYYILTGICIGFLCFTIISFATKGEIMYNYPENNPEKLRDILNQNPDLPLMILVGETATFGSGYEYDFASIAKVYKGKYLIDNPLYDGDGIIYSKEGLEEYIRDKYEFFDDTQLYEKMAKYDKYWKDCIFLVVNN